MEHLPGSLFDERMKELTLTVIKPTQMQWISELVMEDRVLNGNRFCVVETPENKNVIPEFIPIVDPTTKRIFNVKITYKGQERYCAVCNVKHMGQCPKLKEFYEARHQREEMIKNNEIRTKVYSDSTLRNVDTLGLRAEVCTMSGGGLGQVAQAAIDDPDRTDIKNILIIGGANDVKKRDFTSNTEFAINVNTSMCKIAQAVKTEPDKNFILVKMLPKPEEGDFIDDDTNIRQLYIQKQIDAAADNSNVHFNEVKNVATIAVEYDVDETGHPTEDGTIQILNQINEQLLLPKPFIWNDKFIKSERFYSHVEAIYRYGCNGCLSYGKDISTEKHSNQLLCDKCYDSMVQMETETMFKELEEITKMVQESKVIFENSDNDSENMPDSKRVRITDELSDTSTLTDSSEPPLTVENDGEQMEI